MSSASLTLVDAGVEYGRVYLRNRSLYRLFTASVPIVASLSGTLRHGTPEASKFPVVGDWVVLRRMGQHRGLIQAVLPRRSTLARKVAGRKAEEQVAAIALVVALSPSKDSRVQMVRWRNIVIGSAMLACLLIAVLGSLLLHHA